MRSYYLFPVVLFFLVAYFALEEAGLTTAAYVALAAEIAVVVFHVILFFRTER